MPQLQQPFTLFLLQLLAILVCTRAAGWALRKVGQPSVVGEIIAGIMLGPSVLGAVFPALSIGLFPKTSLGSLGMLSEIGLVIFMFTIGIELDAGIVGKKARQAVIISLASIIVPFVMGIALSLWLYPRYAAPGAPFRGFVLFTGIAMSITAFPVLARILQERGIATTRLGMLAISCAAADDVIAWCALAVVTAIIKAGGFAAAGITLILALIYVLLMLLVIKPMVHRLLVKKGSERLQSERPQGSALRDDKLPRHLIPLALSGMIASAAITQIIGIHALFGAFLAGLIIPVDWRHRTEFISRIADLALVLLLPVFFVMTGLRTEIGLLQTGKAWAACGLIIAVAIAGKGGGAALSARITGESWRDALAIGALMNTRGLMQMIVLNIGYELGILTPAVFTMMVVMAIVTTMLTGPVLNFLRR